MAPAASQLVVGGDSCDNGFFGLQALFDADLAVLNGIGDRPLAQIASNSWLAGDESGPANMLQITHAYLIRAADEGVSMLFSSGDASGVGSRRATRTPPRWAAPRWASASSNPRLFETGWSTGISAEQGGQWAFQGEDGASGGGASLLWKQPGYQHGVVPDALATAAGRPGRPGPCGPGHQRGRRRVHRDGRRDAELRCPGQRDRVLRGADRRHQPRHAAGRGHRGRRRAGPASFGFLNPALYRLAGTKAFHDARPLSAKTSPAYRGVACDADTCGLLLLTTFDDQSWSMAGYTGQVTAPGLRHHDRHRHPGRASRSSATCAGIS